ncbi:hypothetical protein GQ457_08G004730 [Hibiscus cannabinus]
MNSVPLCYAGFGCKFPASVQWEGYSFIISLNSSLPSTSAFLFIFSCLFSVTIRIRHHRSHSEHEQFRIVSHVSIPPSPAPEASVAGPRYSVFNVLGFDATGDGVIDDTQNM